MITFAEFDAHTPLLMVHRMMLVPEARAVTVLTGDNELVTVPPPETSDQVPTPVVIVFAANTVVGLLMQIV